jgi:hypothetical protein
MGKVKFFLDTEFNERGRFYPLELISIGIVCENGKRLYLENVEADRKLCNDWVKENVLVHLNTSREIQEAILDKIPFDTNGLLMSEQESIGDFCHRDTYNLMTIREIACRVKDFISLNSLAIGNKPEFWGYFCDYDWVIFCQLFGTMIELPKGFPYYCNDLKQLVKFYEINLSLDELTKTKSNHNALQDAKQIKNGYDIITSTMSHKIIKKQFHLS